MSIDKLDRTLTLPCNDFNLWISDILFNIAHIGKDVLSFSLFEWSRSVEILTFRHFQFTKFVVHKSWVRHLFTMNARIVAQQSILKSFMHAWELVICDYIVFIFRVVDVIQWPLDRSFMWIEYFQIRGFIQLPRVHLFDCITMAENSVIGHMRFRNFWSYFITELSNCFIIPPTVYIRLNSMTVFRNSTWLFTSYDWPMMAYRVIKLGFV